MAEVGWLPGREALGRAGASTADLSKGRKAELTVVFHFNFPVFDLRHLPIAGGLLHFLICFHVKHS